MNHALQQSDLAHWQEALEAALPRPSHGPIHVRVYKQTRSTQDIAKSFAPGPALVIADQQTAGRGRLGRSWLSVPGAAVLMSLVYPNAAHRPTHDRVSMLAGVAVAEAVAELMPDVEVRLKWPNDVMVEGKKLAGILIETVRDAAVIGVGLNVLSPVETDPSLRDIATSFEALGRPIDRLPIIHALGRRLIQTLENPCDAADLAAWKSLASLGQTQTFEHNGQRITGTVLDLDPDHGLIVRRDSGEIVTLPAATTSVVS